MTDLIGVVDYGLGNPVSVQNMLHRVGLRAVVSSDVGELARMRGLVLPGVGHFAAGMENLERRRLVPFLREFVPRSRIPLLGICLGMQLLATHSEEGDVKGLGLVDARIVKFRRDKMARAMPVPHMGWNSVSVRRSSMLTSSLATDSRFYFVHSFHAVTEDASLAVMTTNYGYEFVSAFEKNNIAGVQFHPEKSHMFGKALLASFFSGRVVQERAA